MDVLKVKELHKSYREGFFLKSRPVLKGLNFSLKEGRITGFLGGNGSGKTTTLKCILNLSFPNRGEVTFFGSKALNIKIKKKIGFLPEHPYFYSYLTGFEFLKFFGCLASNWKKNVLRDRIYFLLKRVSLFEKKDHLLKTYSKGMLQRIGMAQALIHEPEFLILDEPLGGLDPFGRQTVLEVIQDSVKKGASIFFSSHLLHDAESLCQDLVILKEGKVVYEGEMSELLDQMRNPICIKYKKKDKIEELNAKDEEDLQIKIDKLRKKQAFIIEIRRNKKTLEEAFNQMNLSSESKLQNKIL